jgi:predicted O-methyltransferase YrrM
MKLKDAVQIAIGVEGFMQPIELHWLAMQASACNTILEIGSWKGRSTKAMALVCPGTVYAVDHWDGSKSELATTHSEVLKLGVDGLFNIFKANLSEEIKTNKVIPIREDSQAAAIRLRGEKGLRWIDMVFIDGEHTYEAVKKDILSWTPHVAPGGLLCGHDYFDSPDVRKAVTELIPERIEGSIWSYIVP